MSAHRKAFISGLKNGFTRLLHAGFSFEPEKIGQGKKVFFYGIFLTLLFLCLHLFNPKLISFLENKLYDIMHDSLEHQNPPLPLIVDIDEKSLKQLGQWPWSRYQVAKLLQKISDAGAASIGVDILFSEPDRTSLTQVKKELHKELDLNLDLDHIPHHLRDNDIYLAGTIEKGPFILGYKFFFSGPPNTSGSLVPLDLMYLTPPASKQKKRPPDLYTAEWVLEPLQVLSSAMGGGGFTNVRPDTDGVIRRIPLLIRYNEKIYPGLALASVMKAMKIKKGILKLSDMGVEALYLGNTNIPLDSKGNMHIKYRGKQGTFDYISAIDLLNDEKGIKERIADRIVFVGTSASGLKDSYTTPLDTLFPGVEVHASVADNILNKNFINRPEWSRGVEVVITLISGVLISLVFAVSTPLISVVFPGIMMTGLWLAAIGMLRAQNMFFSPLYPLINIGGCFAVLSLLRFRIAENIARKKAGEIHRMESELSVAREIQMGVIPKIFPPFPDQDYFDLFADLIPAREVGGDLYDFFFMDEDHLCFTIGDVADKGVPASLFMVITRTLIKNLVGFYNSPADLMGRINNILSINNPRSLFVTLFIGVLDLKTGRVVYSNGGHNLPVLFSRSKGIFFKKGISGPVVGAIPDMAYDELSFALEPGDGIFLYTDGVTEAMDKKREMFSDDQLLQVCRTLDDSGTNGVVNTILQQVRRHAGSTRQSDDIAMMMLRFHKKKTQNGI